MGKVLVGEFLDRVLTSDERVGFSQVDGYNHLNSACYVDMVLDHRGFAADDQVGVSGYELGKQIGMAMVVQQLSVRYVSSALLQERLEVASWAYYVQSDGFRIRSLISNKESKRVRAAFQIAFRIIDIKTGKLMALPQEWPSSSVEDLISKLPLAAEYVKTLKGVAEGFLLKGLAQD